MKTALKARQARLRKMASGGITGPDLMDNTDIFAAPFDWRAAEAKSAQTQGNFQSQSAPSEGLGGVQAKLHDAVIAGLDPQQPIEMAKSLWHMAKEGFTLPHDVYQGKIDPNSPEAIRRSMDLAMTLPVAGLAAAQRGAVGSAGGDLMRLYHGTNPRPSTGWPHKGKFDLAEAHPNERGVFLTPDPQLAEGFGKTIMPVDFKPENIVTADLRKIDPDGLAYQGKIVETAIKSARKMGKDAVIIKGLIEDPSLGPVSDQVVVLNPKGLVKSATTGETLFSNPENAALPAAIAAGQRAEPFYSRLHEAIDKSSLNKAQPQQWQGWLKNQPGISPEELEWTGLNKFLSETKGPVTKADIAMHLENNPFKVGEKIKGKTDSLDEIEEEAIYQYESRNSDLEGNYYDDAGELADDLPDFYSLPAPEQENYRSIARAERGSIAGADDTKFSQHTLPGGENYRELLLTLPQKETEAWKPKPYDPSKWTAQKNPGETDWSVRDEAGNLINSLRINARNKTDAVRQAVEHVERGDGTIANGYGKPRDHSGFKSSHFDEPNILAHVRFNDRTDVNGKKTLFLEEVQSDWHQKGRKQGYADPKARAEHEAVTKKLNDAGYPLSNADAELAVQDGVITQAEASAFRQGSSTGVPNAPFKKEWPELALKRMVKWAADNGYDQIAWTPGKVQAERYDLSKQVSRVEYHNGRLNAYDKSNHRLIDKDVKPEELPDVIGKEAAEKLMAKEPPKWRVERRISNDNFPYAIVDEKGTVVDRFYNQGAAQAKVDRLPQEFVKELRGVELEIGGEGMKGFYDKIMPTVANKLGKKYGAKVGSTKINQRKFLDSRNKDEILHELQYSPSQWDALPQAEKEALLDQHYSQGLEVHTLPITPELRTHAQTKGFQLFANPKEQSLLGALAAAKEPKPIRAYHGTGHQFNKFDPKKENWFTDSPDEADFFAQISSEMVAHEKHKDIFKAEGQRVLPVDIDTTGFDVLNYRNKVWDNDIDDFVKKAKEKGSPGVTIKNVRGDDWRGKSTYHLPLRQETVKSATTGETLFANPKEGGSISLVVAIKKPNGEVIYGKPGQHHGELPLSEGTDGFAIPGGKFMTREQALEYIRKTKTDWPQDEFANGGKIKEPFLYRLALKGKL